MILQTTPNATSGAWNESGAIISNQATPTVVVGLISTGLTVASSNQLTSVNAPKTNSTTALISVTERTPWLTVSSWSTASVELVSSIYRSSGSQSGSIPIPRSSTTANMSEIVHSVPHISSIINLTRTPQTDVGSTVASYSSTATSVSCVTSSNALVSNTMSSPMEDSSSNSVFGASRASVSSGLAVMPTIAPSDDCSLAADIALCLKLQISLGLGPTGTMSIPIQNGANSVTVPAALPQPSHELNCDQSEDVAVCLGLHVPLLDSVSAHIGLNLPDLGRPQATDVAAPADSILSLVIVSTASSASSEDTNPVTEIAAMPTLGSTTDCDQSEDLAVCLGLKVPLLNSISAHLGLDLPGHLDAKVTSIPISDTLLPPTSVANRVASATETSACDPLADIDLCLGLKAPIVGPILGHVGLNLPKLGGEAATPLT